MAWMYLAINALVQATVWLTLTWAAVTLLTRRNAAVGHRVLALRVGMVGLPIVLAVGWLAPALPWCRPVVNIPAAARTLPTAFDLGLRSNLEDPALHAYAVVSQPTPSAPDLAGAAAPPDARPCPIDARPPAAAAPAASAARTARPITILEAWLTLGQQALLTLAGLMWATGLLAGSWHLVRGLLKLRRRRARWQPVGNERVRRIAAVLAGKLGLRRPFQLLAADDLPTPVAVGVLHPAVVIPRDQFRHLASPEGRAVLVHELAHLRFLDPFWRLLGASITVLLWWHPLMRWLNRRIEIESEFLCDQAALGSGADRRGYARMLVGLAQIAWVDRPLAAAAIGAVHRTSHLERRVSMILSRTFGQVAAVSRRVRLLATALAIGLVLTLSSVSLLGEQNLGLTDNDASVAEAAQATPAVATVPAPKAIADQPTAAHDVAPAAPDPQVTRLEGMLDKARKALEEARALPESNPDRAQTIQLAELRVSRIQRTLDETRSAAQAKAPAPPPADGNSDTDANAVNGQDPSARSSDDEDEDEHEAEHENEREGDRRARGERREGERHEGDRRFGDRRFGWRPGGEGVRPPTTQPEGESDFAGNRAQFEQRRKQVEALRDQAQTLANESKWQEVIGILDQLKELIPEDPRLWGAYARTYDQMGEKEKAEAARVKMHEILAKLRIRRTFGALDNARARAAFESALAHAPGVRWEKSTDGSYAVTGTFFSQRRLAETHDRLTGNAPPTPPGDGAGRSDRFRRRGGEGENASGGERRRNQQPGGEREEDDD